MVSVTKIKSQSPCTCTAASRAGAGARDGTKTTTAGPAPTRRRPGLRLSNSGSSGRATIRGRATKAVFGEFARDATKLKLRPWLSVCNSGDAHREVRRPAVTWRGSQCRRGRGSQRGRSWAPGLAKFHSLVQISQFGPNITILSKFPNFGQISQFWAKITILTKNLQDRRPCCRWSILSSRHTGRKDL